MKMFWGGRELHSAPLGREGRGCLFPGAALRLPRAILDRSLQDLRAFWWRSGQTLAQGCVCPEQFSTGPSGTSEHFGGEVNSRGHMAFDPFHDEAVERAGHPRVLGGSWVGRQATRLGGSGVTIRLNCRWKNENEKGRR